MFRVFRIALSLITDAVKLAAFVTCFITVVDWHGLGGEGILFVVGVLLHCLTRFVLKVCAEIARK